MLPVTVAAGDPPEARRFVSLRARLLAIVTLVLVPWLVLVILTQADERKVAIANVGDDAMALVHIITSNQAAQVEAARQLLIAFARLPQLRNKDRAACSALMAEMLKAYPLYLNIGLVEPDGNITCSGVPLREPVNVADRLYFELAIQTRDFVVGDYQTGRVTKRPSINYAYPLLDAAGNVEAVIYIAQSLDWLTVALAGVQLPSDAILAVTDRNGTVLARYRLPKARWGCDLPNRRSPPRSRDARGADWSRPKTRVVAGCGRTRPSSPEPISTR